MLLLPLAAITEKVLFIQVGIGYSKSRGLRKNDDGSVFTIILGRPRASNSLQPQIVRADRATQSAGKFRAPKVKRPVIGFGW